MKTGIERITQSIHVASAFWVLVLALIIFVDVTGRQLFDSPLLGAPEIIKNSVVSITFLQIPLAIYRGGMVRTTVIYDAVSHNNRRLLRTLANFLGLIFFLGTALSSWDASWQALAIGEYEGEGALRVPTWPVRFLVMVTSAYAAFIYGYLAYLDWTGRLGEEHGEGPTHV